MRLAVILKGVLMVIWKAVIRDDVVVLVTRRGGVVVLVTRRGFPAL